MPRFKLTIEYAGTRYSGWQIQKNARTVRARSIARSRTVTGRKDFELYGSGRTDAGVHALGQVAHLDVAPACRPSTLRRRLNDELPADINILAAEHGAAPLSRAARCGRRGATSTRFARAARRSRSRTSGGSRNRSTSSAMRDAAARVRRHARLRLVRRATTATRTSRPIDARAASSGSTSSSDGDLLLVGIEGSHFLWKMVRRHRRRAGRSRPRRVEPDAAAALLRSDSDAPARLTAPASGLFLERVYYQGEPRAAAIAAPIAVRE